MSQPQIIPNCKNLPIMAVLARLPKFVSTDTTRKPLLCVNVGKTWISATDGCKALRIPTQDLPKVTPGVYTLEVTKNSFVFSPSEETYLDIDKYFDAAHDGAKKLDQAFTLSKSTAQLSQLFFAIAQLGTCPDICHLQALPQDVEFSVLHQDDKNKAVLFVAKGLCEAVIMPLRT